MSKHTKIQWADSTINPTMGCDGCPLFPVPAIVASQLAAGLPFAACHRPAIGEIVAGAFGNHATSDLYHFRHQIAEEIATGLAKIEALEVPRDLPQRIVKEIAAHVRCYAAILHTRYGKNPISGKHTNRGYAPKFGQVTKFPGRMQEVARWADLTGTSRPEDPWLNGLPRLLFVSDMGDALSKEVDFPYLKQEIIDVVNSAHGKAHIWLWLTKRPRRMAQFAKWLGDQGVVWPDNLVPMTSVLDAKMATQVKYLRDIPAKVRGLSVEPLWEGVELDLTGIDWVIVGGESGSAAKPFQLEWARSLRAQCARAGASFFMKQLGAKPCDNGSPLKLKNPHGGDWSEWPEDLRIREMPVLFHELTVPRPIKTKRLK